MPDVESKAAMIRFQIQIDSIQMVVVVVVEGGMWADGELNCQRIG
jgi:hypothetical protein